MSTPRPRVCAAILAGLAAALCGCQTALFAAAMPFVYREVSLPAEQVVRDVPYLEGADADPDKHRLHLFLPAAGRAGAWPVVVFVHGGGWTWGDRDLRIGGRDVYGNVGRWFAARGIGAAVISYRLQPGVDWTAQVRDVAAAVAWVRANVGAYGGDPDAIFVMGHSAGAQLAAHVALGPGSDARGICGLIPVSGAGFDLADEETYALGADPGYYARRFRNGDPGESWKREASPVRLARPDAPPALILYAEDDWPAVRRQNELLEVALREAGVATRILQVPGEDHYSVVLALTRDDKAAAPAILAFIRDTGCPRGPAAPHAWGPAPQSARAWHDEGD